MFRTRAAKGLVTGRNAGWTVSDQCNGTLTKVRRGRVRVRAAPRTVTVAPECGYLVRARLFGARRNRSAR